MQCGWRQRTWLLPRVVRLCISEEVAGPLKAKMVSYKLQFLPSVSFLPLRDHRAFEIEPELTTFRDRKTETGDGEASVLTVEMTVVQI